MNTPTSRTLALLRRQGYVAAVVERWVPRLNVRKDLFGCIDLVAVHPREAGVLGVQTTTAANMSARVKKATALPALRTWLQAGNRFECWAWARRGNRWAVKVVPVRPADLDETEPGKPLLPG
jgi:hypothetical protein